MKRILAAILWGVALAAAAAIEPAPFADPATEVRYRELLAELRCPKCQNQSLADSDAPIAADLRAQVRRLMQEGASDEEIVAYLVARYGDFVRYRPPVDARTLGLWLGPLALLALGGMAVWAVARRARPAGPAALSPEERERLAQLLDEQGEGPP